MLLTQQLEEMDLPHAEAGVVRTLLEKGSALRGGIHPADRRGGLYHARYPGAAGPAAGLRGLGGFL